MNEQKEKIKQILGVLPLTAEFYSLLRPTDLPDYTKYSLKDLKEFLPSAVMDVNRLRIKNIHGKKVFLFASIHYWIEHVTVLGLALSARGNDVTVGYFPYGRWNIVANNFDIRRQSIYTSKVLRMGYPAINSVNFLRTNSTFIHIPKEIEDSVINTTDYDFMYAFQTENIDKTDPLYNFRLERNLHAAKALYSYLRSAKPDVVIVPNGTILEFGVAYQVSKYLKIPTTTYEFSDQRDSIWITQNDQIMQQNTDQLWAASDHMDLDAKEKKQLKELMSARTNASLYGNFSRMWQKQASEGGSTIKQKLKLDDRPVALMATNVLGDSLTLGRNVFTKSMTEWIIRSTQYFMEKPEIQLVIRIHPGEMFVTHGSIYELIKHTLPSLPENIHLVAPEAKINTYDLMEIADLGMVYTTTAGLEMSMQGIPVVVAGKTHYRGRGFTFDPVSWVDYFKILNKLIGNLKEMRLTKDQIDLAWKYAYLFFFKYPKPFPWHMIYLAEDIKEKGISDVLSGNGLRKYKRTLDLFTFESEPEPKNGNNRP